MTTPISTLELRKLPIPDGPITRLYKLEHERLTGKPLTHEQRHYLAGQPVHCGEILELYRSGQWFEGRYKWNARLDEEPTLETSAGTFWLDGTKLLRWPTR